MPNSLAARGQLFNAATADLDPPLLALDLEAFDRNSHDLVRRAARTPIRVASKSLRCRSLINRALATPGYAGVLAFTLPEALWLATERPDGSAVADVVVGYPSVDRSALRQLVNDPVLAARVTLMIDDSAQLDVIRSVRSSASVAVRVCIDVDSSWRPRLPTGASQGLHVGARRSPLHTVEDVLELVRRAALDETIQVVGLMFYEAQIAGVANDVPGHKLRSNLIRGMQLASGRELAHRRPAIVSAVSELLAQLGKPGLEFVNAGGTGSLEQSSADDSVTEVTAGSGLYGPVLFDNYRHFQPAPALAFALPVVRRPAPNIVTVLGGGYVASGAIGPDRLPTPWIPAGLRLDGQEAAGEVQTPLHGTAAETLAIGDRVWFRHSKAGEICERFDQIQLVSAGELRETVPTYRGEGQCFL